MTQVSLVGQTFENISDVRFELNTPVAEQGIHGGITQPMKVTIWRDALEDPQIEGFQLASEVNLTLKSTGEITLYDAYGEMIYRLELKNYFFAGWELEGIEQSQSEMNGEPLVIPRRLREVMVIYAGEVALHGKGSSNHSFVNQTFQKGGK